MDEEYAAYFSDMLDTCIENGVEPMVCLEHYELPTYLLDKYNGWSSRHVVDLFVKYALKAFERFGDRVKYWFAFNEPIVIQTRSYLDAVRWLIIRILPCGCNGIIIKHWLRQRLWMPIKKSGYKRPECKFGSIINVETVYPRSDSKGDCDAADMYDLFYNRVFLDPALKGEYQEGFFELLKKHGIEVEHTAEELALIKENTLIGLELICIIQIG